MSTPLQTYFPTSSGQLVRYGRSSTTLPGTDRDDLVLEQYEPDEGTAGVPAGVTLANYNAASTATVTLAAGTYTRQRIHGRIAWSGDVNLVECELLGPQTTGLSGDEGIINGNNSNTGHLTATDCTIRPQVETNGRNGALGKEFSLIRCRIYGGVDAVGIYTLTAWGTPNANVDVHGCLLDDLVYVYPDTITTSHTDGTHNDCIQVQGGGNISIRGCSIRAYAHPLAGTGTNPVKPYLLDGGRKWANGAGIIVQKQSSTYAITNLVISGNYTRGGLTHLNAKTASAGTYSYTNNRSYRDVAIKPAGYPSGDSLTGYWLRLENRAAANITGINSSASTRWVDYNDGALLAEPRSSGIHYDA